MLSGVTKAKVGVEAMEVGMAEWFGEDVCNVIIGVYVINA